MFKVDWIFIPITIIYFIIIFIILTILTVKYFINKFNKQIQIDINKICSRNIGIIGRIIPFEDISRFDKQNAQSFLNIDLGVSIWSGCQKALPQIPSFDVIQTYKGYDYAAKLDRNIAALYYSKSLNIAIMSFSGTMYLSEWANDFDFTQTNPVDITGDNNILVHEKDYIMYNTLRNDFISSVNKIKDNNTILVVTGHSLGGVLATICFFDIISNNVITKELRTLYTFGAPRVGNVAFTNIINNEKNQFRVVNTEDIITNIPLPINGNKIYQQTNTSSNTVFSLNLGNYGLNHIDSYVDFLK